MISFPCRQCDHELMPRTAQWARRCAARRGESRGQKWNADLALGRSAAFEKARLKRLRQENETEETGCCFVGAPCSILHENLPSCQARWEP